MGGLNSILTEGDKERNRRQLPKFNLIFERLRAPIGGGLTTDSIIATVIQVSCVKIPGECLLVSQTNLRTMFSVHMSSTSYCL